MCASEGGGGLRRGREAAAAAASRSVGSGGQVKRLADLRYSLETRERETAERGRAVEQKTLNKSTARMKTKLRSYWQRENTLTGAR